MALLPSAVISARYGTLKAVSILVNQGKAQSLYQAFKMVIDKANEKHVPHGFDPQKPISALYRQFITFRYRVRTVA